MRGSPVVTPDLADGGHAAARAVAGDAPEAAAERIIGSTGWV
jgi:hypothetical protein